MNLSVLFRKICVVSCVLVVIFTLTNCKSCKKNTDEDEKKQTYYDNENDPIVFSSAEVDKVFNPFFSTSGTDSNVVGFTQIGMLGNDKNGNITYGDNEAVVVKDLEITTTGEKDVDQITEYRFVLKNNVKYSNGSPLTIKDVLFNLYVYLDKAYTGSSTIYSTDIVGLQEYRTQAATEKEQNSFNKKFQLEAEARIQALVSAATEIFDEHKNEDISSIKFIEYLEDCKTISNTYANVVKDYQKAVELFSKELENDYNNAIDSYEDITFSDEDGKVYKNLFTTDVEVFLYNEGYISWNKKDKKLSSTLENDPTKLKTWTKEKAIEIIIMDKIPSSIEEVVMFWNTSVTLSDYIANESLEKYFEGSTLKYKNISGITFINQKEPTTVNNVVYNMPTYNQDGSVNENLYEVLSIKIHDVDPKAIYNFAFSVAPMYYYSDEKHIKAFDYEENFGVEYASQTFMNDVVKNSDKVGVPMGAGPYAASKSSGGFDNVKSGDFYDLGMIYYERNPYYLMGPAKIKKLRLKIVAANQMLNTLYSGEVHFVEPNAKPETIAELDGYEGTYVNDSNSLVVDGVRNITLNGTTGEYAVTAEASYTLDAYIDGSYYEITLDKATMQYTINKPMVTISYSAGEKAVVSETVVNKNINFDLPVPENDAYIFRCWYSDEELTKPVDANYKPIEDITLYAKWDSKVSLTVVYGNDMEDVTLYYGSGDVTAPVVPAFTNGKVFDGWYNEIEFTNPYSPSAIEANTTIYCKWKAAIAMIGTYSGFETWGSTGSGSTIYGGSSKKSLTVDAEGIVSGTYTGTITEYDGETGEFILVEGTRKYFGVYNKSANVLAINFNSMADNVRTLGNDVYFFFKDAPTALTSSSSACYWNGGKTKLMTVEITTTPIQSVTVLLLNEKVYYNVSFTSNGNTVATKDAYKSEQLTVLDAEGNVIANFVKGKDGLEIPK